MRLGESEGHCIHDSGSTHHVGIVQGVCGSSTKKPGGKTRWRGESIERHPRGNVDTHTHTHTFFLFLFLSDTSTTITERIFRRAQANYQARGEERRVERGTTSKKKEKASPSRPKEKLRACAAHAPPARPRRGRIHTLSLRSRVPQWWDKSSRREREREREVRSLISLTPQVRG